MQQRGIVYFLNASSNKTCSTVWCTSCTWTIFEYSVRPAGLCEAPQLCGEFALTFWRKSSVATKRKNALLSLAAGLRRRSAQALRPFAHRNGGARHTCKERLRMGSADPVCLSATRTMLCQLQDQETVTKRHRSLPKTSNNKTYSSA